jgi:adenine/guanine phosphoribosyltransferase-like PRPP-binding protein
MHRRMYELPHGTHIWERVVMSYLIHTESGGLDRTLQTIERACAGHLDEFQSVLCTGLSGIVPAAIFCHHHQKNLVVLRKKDERCHGFGQVEGDEYWLKTDYIIIDDFVSLGHTLSKLQQVNPKRPAKFIVLYKGYGNATTVSRVA